jgi:hypothetical protein
VMAQQPTIPRAMAIRLGSITDSTMTHGKHGLLELDDCRQRKNKCSGFRQRALMKHESSHQHEDTQHRHSVVKGIAR